MELGYRLLTASAAAAYILAPPINVPEVSTVLPERFLQSQTFILEHLDEVRPQHSLRGFERNGDVTTVTIEISW